MAFFRNRDLLAGGLFLLFGAAFLWLSLAYESGSPRRMGPGFFPQALAGLLMLIGVVVLLNALRGRADGEALAGFAWRGLAAVTAGTILFGVLIRQAGLVAAIVALVVVAALGSRTTRPLAVVLLASGLSLFCVLLFVRGLGLPMPVLGTWFGG